MSGEDNGKGRGREGWRNGERGKSKREKRAGRKGGGERRKGES